ncbi:PhoU domain-containing protein [Chloroflexota bacterium]
MVEKTIDMLHRSPGCLVNHDDGTARRIVTEDNEVDTLYSQRTAWSDD